MADLADRGQVILVAAFALAATFVVLTLVVNSAIYTENLASRGETVGSDEALVLRAVAAESVGTTMDYVNRNDNDTESHLEENLSAGVDNVSAIVNRNHATDGAVVEVTGPTTVEHGTRVADVNESGTTFEGATGADNWTVVENVGATRAFTVNVTHGSVVDGTDTFGSPRRDEFYVTVTDGSNEWRMNLTERSGTFTVGVTDPTGPDGTCQVTGTPDYVRIDLTEGTVAGEPCPPLQFASGIGGTYDVRYNNSARVTGNYSFVVDRDDYSNAELTAAPDTDDPYTDHALYESTVVFRYDGPALHYMTDVRVAPGERS